jgi:hypothetical protein
MFTIVEYQKYDKGEENQSYSALNDESSWPLTPIFSYDSLRSNFLMAGRVPIDKLTSHFLIRRVMLLMNAFLLQMYYKYKGVAFAILPKMGTSHDLEDCHERQF